MSGGGGRRYEPTVGRDAASSLWKLVGEAGGCVCVCEGGGGLQKKKKKVEGRRH